MVSTALASFLSSPKRSVLLIALPAAFFLYKGLSMVSTSSFFTRPEEVVFSFDETGRLNATIETERLLITSTKEGDIAHCADLFGDHEVMQTFATGNTFTQEEVCERVNKWIRRWQENDPYTGFSVFEKSSRNFLGAVVIGHGDNPGEAEIAYLFRKAVWGQKYGSEAVHALVHKYAPETRKREYKTLDGEILHTIVATAREDNIASWRILEKVGMRREKEEERYGAKRFIYSISLD
jgi:ribosomal-protein-alanine N-acetyltransferase